ncbi:MAG TPA: MarR family winged helix-turn-helix transcriptional regulator [Candidatus Limnocylindrales bacterium]|nr:MarR family winged helix-turn-helix transcriptional regulator [Candidatus Limnocylindrales bacterium]
MNSSSAQLSVAGPGLEACADLILEVVPQTMRRIRRQMRAQATPPGEGGPTPLTVPQLRALLFIRRKPDVSLSTLSEHLGESAPAASALVERLVRAGLLERRPDPEERRRIQLRLTPDGRARVAHVQAETRTWIMAGLAALRPQAVESLTAGLEALRQATAATPRSEP